MKTTKEHIKVFETLILAASDTREDTLVSIIINTLFQVDKIEKEENKIARLLNMAEQGFKDSSGSHKEFLKQGKFYTGKEDDEEHIIDKKI